MCPSGYSSPLCFASDANLSKNKTPSLHQYLPSTHAGTHYNVSKLCAHVCALACLCVSLLAKPHNQRVQFCLITMMVGAGFHISNSSVCSSIHLKPNSHTNANGLGKQIIQRDYMHTTNHTYYTNLVQSMAAQKTDGREKQGGCSYVQVCSRGHLYFFVRESWVLARQLFTMRSSPAVYTRPQQAVRYVHRHCSYGSRQATSTSELLSSPSSQLGRRKQCPAS